MRPGSSKSSVCYHSAPPREETDLDQPQQLHLFDPKPYEIKSPPKPRPMAESQPFFEPPSDIVVYAYCEGQVVILAQQPTGLEGVAPRPSFMRHRKGVHPKWQAMKIGSLIHENYEGKGILV